MPAPTGFGISVNGRAHPLPAITIHARLPHEVAVPGTASLLVIRPDPGRLRALAGRSFRRVDALCLGLGGWVEGRRSLFVPIADLRPRFEEPIDFAELDLTVSPLWSDIVRELPEEFWVRGADRFGRRHPLLTPLGVPPPLRVIQ